MDHVVEVKCRIDRPDGRPLLGAGRARLLELIQSTGSISAAGTPPRLTKSYV